METKFFNEENIDKYLEMEKNRIKQGEGQKPMNGGKKLDFMGLPDQIDDKIKEKLMRSYEMAKAKGTLNSLSGQNAMKTPFPDL